MRTIASAAVGAKDEPLRELLARNGISISINPAGAAAAPRPETPKPTPARKKER